MTDTTLLDVRDLQVHFPLGGGLLRRARHHVKAVGGVSFNVPRGTTFGIVGESGCGKSTVAAAILRPFAPLRTSAAPRATVDLWG